VIGVPLVTGGGLIPCCVIVDPGIIDPGIIDVPGIIVDPGIIDVPGIIVDPGIIDPGVCD
jgi:hypothetical protein